MFNEKWLRPWATVPIDHDTTSALLKEVERLRKIETAAMKWREQYLRNGDREPDPWGIVTALSENTEQVKPDE